MSAQSQFESILKQSPHFADVANTTRTAVAQIVAAFVGELVRRQQLPPEALADLLRYLEGSSGHPSIDSERRHMVWTIREFLQARK